MMKKIILITMTISMCFLTACSTTTKQQETTSTIAQPILKPVDLTGKWKQVNNLSEDSWQAATIKGKTITIYWISDNGDTKSLYWAGSYNAPKKTGEPYVWKSKNNHEKTRYSIMASDDKYKTFTYENNQISYSSSMLGVTKKVRLEKINK